MSTLGELDREFDALARARHQGRDPAALTELEDEFNRLAGKSPATSLSERSATETDSTLSTSDPLVRAQQQAADPLALKELQRDFGELLLAPRTIDSLPPPRPPRDPTASTPPKKPFLEDVKEGLTGGQPAEDLIPFAGAGLTFARLAQVHSAVQRLEGEQNGTYQYQDILEEELDFSTPLVAPSFPYMPPPKRTGRYRRTPADQQRQQDVDALLAFQRDLEETENLGTAGKIARGIRQLPAFITEFILSSPAGAFGKNVTKKAVQESIEKLIAGRVVKSPTFLKGAAGFTGETAARTALQAARVGAEFEQRSIPTFQFTEKGRLLIRDDTDPTMTRLLKAIGDVAIEQGSEISGPIISRFTGRVVPQAVQDFLRRLPGATLSEKFNRATGIGGFAEEFLEERAGDVARAITGVSDLGVEEDGFEGVIRRLAAARPSSQDLLVEAGVLLAPQIVRQGIGAMNLGQQRGDQVREDQPLRQDDARPSTAEEGSPSPSLDQGTITVPSREQANQIADFVAKLAQQVSRDGNVTVEPRQDLQEGFEVRWEFSPRQHAGQTTPTPPPAEPTEDQVKTPPPPRQTPKRRKKKETAEEEKRLPSAAKIEQPEQKTQEAETQDAPVQPQTPEIDTFNASVDTEEIEEPDKSSTPLPTSQTDKEDQPVPTQALQPSIEDQPPPVTSAANHQVELARRVKGIVTDEPMDRARLTRLAEEVYGGTQAEGTFGPSEINDAFEVGFNQSLVELLSASESFRQAATDPQAARKTLQAVSRLVEERFPTQRNRSGEKDRLQQFSTPPDYGFVVNWLANVTSSDTVLEPSAGTGNLAVFAKLAGARVQANEISEKRAALLEELGLDRITREDAEQIHNILPEADRPQVVLMNPPFSRAGTRHGNKRIIGTDLNHIDTALEHLADGGRLVAIIGRRLKGGDTQIFSRWLQAAEEKHHVRAVIDVKREVYKKLGTDFPTRILVIDKTDPAGQQARRFPEMDLADIIETQAVQELRHDRSPSANRETQPSPGQSAGPQVPPSTSHRRRPDATVRPATGGVRPEKVEAGGIVGPEPERSVGHSRKAGAGDRPGRGAGVSRTKGGGSKANRPGTAGPDAPRDDAARGRGVSDRKPVRQSPASQPGLKPVQRTVSPSRKRGKFTDNVFEPYQVAKATFAESRPHPASMVESAAMSVVDLPEVAYVPQLEQDLIASGALSDIQLEPIVYAGQAHSTFLDEKDKEGRAYRRGFLIGDGTGVGKGREIAGIIRDNWNAGRRKAVWISENQKLLQDAVRDWSALGGNKEDLQNLTDIKPTAEIKSNEGILYTTYSTMAMKAKGKSKQKSRLDQIVTWLGEDFDGVIAFDEAHNMGNPLGTGTGAGRKKPSAKAIAGVELQRLLPQARVVYVSATAATEVRNLAYADRLGLWGTGTPFTTKEQFIAAIGAGGVSAMEMTATNLKAMGLYLSRNISFNDGTDAGTVKYRRLEHKLTASQRQVYDKLAQAWQVIFNDVQSVLGETQGPFAISQFYSAQQRFFNQLLISMQTPAVIRDIRKQTQAGHSAVVQLTNTMEAAQQRAIDQAAEENNDDFDITPRDIVMQFVENSFPTVQHETFTDENGTKRTRPVKDANGNPVHNRQAVAQKEKLLDELASLQVPDAPIDMILNALGPENVAEVTGRKQQIIEQGGRKVIRKRLKKEGLHNQAEIDAFMADRKQVLIFSEAGGTGASYHAALNAQNQSQRVHYLLQPGWRADKALQGLGRTHRSFQKQAPEYILVTTDIPGQKRFISTIARRLDQLGALSKGQRQAGSTGVFTAADNLESPEAAQALRVFLHELQRNSENPPVDPHRFQTQTGLRLFNNEGQPVSLENINISRFLNRVLALDVTFQNEVFDAFMERVQEQVEIAARNGTLDQGLETVKADRVGKVSENEVFQDPKTQTTARHVAFSLAYRTHPAAFEEVLAEGVSFFAVNEKSGRVFAFKDAPDRTNPDTGSIEQRYHRYGVNYKDGGRHYDTRRDIDHGKNWRHIDKTEARRLWDAEVEKTPEFREQSFHLLTGTLLPIWNRIGIERPRIKRIQTDEGESFLGLHIPSGHINTLLRKFDIQQQIGDVNPTRAAEDLLAGNVVLKLGNDWTLKRARVQGEARIEIIGPDFTNDNVLEDIGVFKERINFKNRYFVPVGPRATGVLEKIFEISPVAEFEQIGDEPVTFQEPQTGTAPEGQASAFPDPTQTPVDPINSGPVSPANMPMRTEAPRGTLKTIAAPQVMRQLAQVLEAFGSDVPIRTGRIARRRRHRGVFLWNEEVIRIRTANDIVAATHEVGHALEKAVYGSTRGGPWSKAIVSAKMRDELHQLGKNLYGSTRPQGGYKREGFAEFMRFWLTDRDRARREAPVFAEWFENEFLAEFPKGHKALEKAHRDILRFQEQGSVQRGLQGVVETGSLSERAKATGRKLKRAVSPAGHVDMLLPVFQFTSVAEKKSGRTLSAEENPWIVSQALRGTHSARTREMVERCMIDLAGNCVGAPLQDIRALVKNRRREFTVYLWAQRARALWLDPRRPEGRNPGLTLNDADQIVRELEKPEFQLAAQKVYDWNEGVLNYAAGASPSFAQALEQIREADPGYYIPLHREFQHLDGVYARRAGTTSARSGQLTRHLVGSGRRILDPFPGMIAQAERIVKAAHNRYVLDRMIKLSKVEGMGHLITKVPRPRIPHHVTNMEDLIDQLNKRLIQYGAGVELSGDQAVDLAQETITFFTPATQPKPGENPILPVYNPETKRVDWYEVDGELYRALESMEIYRFPQTFGGVLAEWLLGKPARVFRAGTTGLRATFGLVTNPLRDPQTLWVNSQANVNGLHLCSAYFQSMTDAAVRGATGRRNPYLDAFVRLGGEMAQPLGPDTQNVQRAARHLFQGRLLKAMDPRNWYEWYRDLVQLPESAPRIAELRLVAREVGWEPGQPMTLEQSMRMLLAAKQVTTDFTAAGEFGRVINQMVPFYNAAIQGPRANIRAGMRNPRRFFLRGLALTGLTLALWWRYKDEEWYNELTVRERHGFWWFPTDFPEKTLIRIPRAFEVGGLFAALPEALADAWYRQNPQAMKDWMKEFFKSSVPNMTPVLLEESLAQAANRDLYWNTPIVPPRLQQKNPEEQFDEYTSRIAITLGKIFHVSPKRIDHAIQGTFGAVSGDIIKVLGLGPSGNTRDPEAADLPIIGVLFKRGGELGTQPRGIGEMWDTLEKTKRKQHSTRHPETEIEREARLMLEDAARAVSALAYIRRLTPQTERRRQLTKAMLEIARQANQLYKSGEIDRLYFRSLRKRFEEDREAVEEQLQR